MLGSILYTSVALLLVLAGSALAQFTIAVGAERGGLVIAPESVVAAPGSTIEFIFYPAVSRRHIAALGVALSLLSRPEEWLDRWWMGFADMKMDQRM